VSRVIVVTGAAAPAGQAVVRGFAERGDSVIAVDKSGTEGTLAVDLLDEAAVRDLAKRIEAEHGHVDGVVHLVGGWRGAPTFAQTSLADWDLLHDLLVRTVQHVTLAFEPLLKAAPEGRFVIVSAKTAQNPKQGDAVYAAAKAAAEAWTLAFADALRGTPAAAVILVVTALVHDAMRAANPDKDYRGHTDVADLAAAITGLWDGSAPELNGRRVDLTS
jgi:NAD(P)-dependent dehydrogenase (short-subunit alcohol dehydrogenase family)